MNLQQVPSLNYEPALNNIRASLAQWPRHLLSPLGEITVLKSFIMSKLNYLFLCIPDPSKNFIKTLERLFFKFIWNNKPDKIRRNTICMDYNWGGGGGLRMFDISVQISALKLKWFRKLVQNQNSDYYDFCIYNIKSLKKLLHMGPSWCNTIAIKISNKFWGMSS